KKFTFRLEGLLAFYIVSYILAISINQKAFRDNFISLFFCDVRHIIEGVDVLKDKAFLYSKYRNIFVYLGLITGFKKALKLYQLRRALG
ncbi:uncharacterized protein K441DRAFT_566735, partial [Cenococcum geophilum 1.58]|uniref:uncharacterized protein n=1 Tax=Cenococcum geophilum 1.58 TaxID=794803 RepID=UPI00358E42DE